MKEKWGSALFCIGLIAVGTSLYTLWDPIPALWGMGIGLFLVVVGVALGGLGSGMSLLRHRSKPPLKDPNHELHIK